MTAAYAVGLTAEGGEGPLLDTALPEFERVLIRVAMKRTQGHRQDAARLLGWGRNTLTRKLKEFFPPDLSVLGRTLESLGETFEIAVVATFFSCLISLPLALAAARTISPGWLVVIARMVLNAIRTIPSLIWALLAVAVVGANPLAGVIGTTRRARFHGVETDVIALPHPSGVSTWHRGEPGKTLLAQALDLIGQHPAWIAATR